MPRLLVAGCGYVGAATAELFHRERWEVEGWTLSEQSAHELSAKPYRVRALDLADPAAIEGAHGEFDVVLLCASSRGGDAEDYRRVYLQSAQHLAAAFPNAALIFTSSTSVYAQTDGEWVTEESPAEPARETGRVLRETENFVVGHGGIVARLAGIYGPGRSALLRKFLADQAAIEPQDRYLNHAHRDDIASALFHLAQNAPTISGRVFNVSDHHPILQRDAYAWLAAQLQRPLPPIASAPAERKRGPSNKRVSSRRLQDLGWQPKYPTFDAAMTESILPNLASCGA